MPSEPDPKSATTHGWRRAVTEFERLIVFILIGMLMIVIAVSTLELGWMLFKDLASLGKVRLNVEEMLELFSFFLLVLIGLELITTLKAYLGDGVVHGEVVLEVALIAIAQKVIIFDVTRASGVSVVGMATLVIALAASFWLVRAASARRGANDGKGEGAR